MADRTTILIAHRRSTLRLAQRIVVIDHGRVVAEGTHEELHGQRRALPRPARRSGPMPPTTPSDDADARRTTWTPRWPTSTDARGAGHRPSSTTLDPVDGITPEAWPEPRATATARRGPMAAGGHGTRVSAPGGNRGGVGGGLGGPMGGAALAATPELLAALDKLPPADDQPQVDEAEAAQHHARPVPRPALRPPLDASGWPSGSAWSWPTPCSRLLGPFFVRRGIDQGVAAHDLEPRCGSPPRCFVAARAASTGS